MGCYTIRYGGANLTMDNIQKVRRSLVCQSTIEKNKSVVRRYMTAKKVSEQISHKPYFVEFPLNEDSDGVCSFPKVVEDALGTKLAIGLDLMRGWDAQLLDYGDTIDSGYLRVKIKRNRFLLHGGPSSKWRA